MEQTHLTIAVTIIGMTFTLIGTLAGIFFNQKFIIKSEIKRAFNIASTKFRTELMPFHHDICEMTFSDPHDSINWSFLTMQKILYKHRAAIDEFRFSIPLKNRHDFNVLADRYCMPKECYDEDEIKLKYFSDGDHKRELSIRKEIRKDLTALMDFKI